MATVLFVYGSTGGNTEMVVENVASVVEGAGHKVTIQRAEQSDPKDVNQYDVCVLASPTYGHGLLQEHMFAFVKSLNDLGFTKRYAVIGLGDPKYDEQYHIESANILEKEVNDRDGELFQPSLRVSKSPVWHLEGIIPHWAKEFVNWI